jgi:hypothetical protein
MAPEFILAIVAAIVLCAGLVSIAGALRRTARRPAGAGRRDDGGPMIPGPGGSRDRHDDDGGDGDGGGD